MEVGETDRTDTAPPGGETARKTRKPYVWSPPPVPGWADFRAGGTRRAGFMRYWRRGGLKDVSDFVAHHALSIMPISLCSALGGLLGRMAARRLTENADRARANLRRIDPTLDDAEVERRVVSHFENAGRVMAEFSVLHRLVGAGRITVENEAALLKAHAEGPLLIISTHTGNWEAVAALMHARGIRWSAVYTPPRTPAQHLIANRVRARFGVSMLPPGAPGVRPTVRTLSEGGTVSMFCDEVHHGKVMAPFFGRPAHVDGNLAIAVRFARMSGAKIFVGHCTRLGGARFHVACSDEVVLPSHTNPDADLQDDVSALNAIIEPIIRKNCGQWYFLDNKFE
ncbi:lysophospholipid acyltransferase family protein [Xanthobacteraceae bacterium A53D]